jgi:ABC-type nitrate/sulfonate/bicarbonate transport system permease component
MTSELWLITLGFLIGFFVGGALGILVMAFRNRDV